MDTPARSQLGRDEGGAQGWLVVFAALLALIVGNGPIILISFGVLLKPIVQEFHWPRSTLASALVVAHVTGAIATPFVGLLVDRFGPKRIALPAIAIFALAFSACGRLGNSPLSFVLLYAVLGIVGTGNSTLVYARAVSTWFDARRGLALGVTLAGVGIGTAAIPKVTQYLVTHYGWRDTYYALGGLVFILAFPVIALFMKDRPADSRVVKVLTRGHTLREAVGSYRFWCIALSLMFVAAAVNGTIADIVPILSDRGVSPGGATTAVSVAGLSVIIGRILSGSALDRLFAPYVALFFFIIPLAGMALLGFGAVGPIAIVAAICLGLGIGAEVDIMAFLAGRYFGMKHFGLIYGCMLSFFTLGSGLGPWLMAHSFDAYGSYSVGLIGLAVPLILAIVLISRLGPYLYPAERR